MTRKLRTIFALTFTLFLFSVSTLACTCVRDTIKSKGFSGQVIAFYKSRPNEKDAVPKATVKLLKRTDDGDKVIAELVTDENGRFNVENLKSGKYILDVRAKNFQTISTLIKVSKAPKQKKEEIIVALDFSLDCCEGYAKVQKSTLRVSEDTPNKSMDVRAKQRLCMNVAR